jgi:dihydrofolate reductase
MSKLRLWGFSVSLDGYGAGPSQDLHNPLGKGGFELHRWFHPTATFRSTQGQPGGTTGPDNDFAAQGFENVGAWIIGRNMFGPIRGPWRDDRWKGWWGDDPPFHTPVFVLTHHPREPVPMAGGTTFHFETGGIHAALERARKAAGELDVRLGGGVNVVRQYLMEGLLDQAHLVVSPILLGSGEHLLGGIDCRALGYHVARHVATDQAMHIVLEKR